MSNHPRTSRPSDTSRHQAAVPGLGHAPRGCNVRAATKGGSAARVSAASPLISHPRGSAWICVLFLLLTLPALAADPATLSDLPGPGVIWFVAGLIVLLNLVHLVVSVWDKTRAKPPAHERYALKTDLDSLRASFLASSEAQRHRLEDLGSSLRAELHAIDQKGEDRAEKIHNRVNLVLAAVSRLEGRLGDRT